MSDDEFSAQADAQPAPTDLSTELPASTLLFRQVVQHLAHNELAPADIDELSEDHAQLVLHSKVGTRFAVHLRRVTTDFDVEAAMHQAEMRAKNAAKHSGFPSPSELVLVGGGQEIGERLKKARKMLSGVGVVHVDNDRNVASVGSNLVAKTLAGLSQTEVSNDSWASVIDAAYEVAAKSAAAASEHRLFHEALNKRVPYATIAIALVIAAMFLAEYLYGGPDRNFVLINLGAVVANKVAAGEWWRLISGTFLHGDVMHAALNVYVLVAIGTFLERLLGSARFLVLYAVSAIAGSIGSILLSGADLSVGASGAIWGLLGAHAALSFRSRGLIAEAMLAPVRKAALINLGLNVLNSFRPNVDMWAHFAGGAAGALLVFSGIATWGLIRKDAAPAPTTTSRPQWALAGLAAISLIGFGPVASLRHAQAAFAPVTIEYTSTHVDAWRATFDVPARLPAQPIDENGAMSWGAPEDAFSVWVFREPYQSTPVLNAAAMIESVDYGAAHWQAPEGSTAIGRNERFSRGGSEPAEGFVSRYRYPSGLTIERAALNTQRQLVLVEVALWLETPAGRAGQGAAKRIALSFIDDARYPREIRAGFVRDDILEGPQVLNDGAAIEVGLQATLQIDLTVSLPVLPAQPDEESSDWFVLYATVVEVLGPHRVRVSLEPDSRRYAELFNQPWTGILERGDMANDGDPTWRLTELVARP